MPVFKNQIKVSNLQSLTELLGNLWHLFTGAFRAELDTFVREYGLHGVSMFARWQREKLGLPSDGDSMGKSRKQN